MNFFIINLYKKRILASFIAIFLAFFVLAPCVSALDCSKSEDIKTGADQAQCGLEKSATQGYLGQAGVVSNDTKIIKDIPTVVGQIVGAVLGFIGILFFILLIYGGFTWMTARGNEEQVKKAIELITQACIGLAIVSAAYLITQFIGETLLDENITTPTNPPT